MDPQRKQWITRHRDYLLLAGAALSGIVLYAVVPSGRPALDGAPPAPSPVDVATTARPIGAERDASAMVPGPDAAAAATAAGDSPRIGPDSARVAIIVAASFECPGCDQLVPMLRAIRETFPNDVALVFKNNPGSTEQALHAAVAALAAHRQGRFWPYHDRLLSAPGIEEADLARHARELGLDLARFAADRKDPALSRQVEEERAALAAFPIGDAPAVVIIGRALYRPLPFEVVRPVIEEELRIAGGGETAPRATPPAIPTAGAGAHGRDGGTAAPDEVLDQFNALLGRGSGKRAPSDPTRRKAEVFGHEPTRGKPDALVTIVEFSDFECKYCSAVLPALARIAEKYPEDVRFVWKHMPLESHARAMPAALVALAAHQRGRFWEMHDRLFTALALDDAELIARGGQVGLSAQDVKGALRNDKLKAIIQKDLDLAKVVNARGTPSFAVNGRMLRGNRHFEDFDALVAEEVAHARTLLARGVARRDVYRTLMAEAKGFQALDDKVHSFTLSKRPILGTPAGDIVLVAFVDFESLNCADNATALRELAADPQLKGRLRIVFKQAPHAFHGMAKNAALAALAAHDQGRYWQFHDKLFANQRYLMPFQLESYAREAGLDLPKYKAYIQGRDGAQQLGVDMAEAQAAGVRAAPIVYLNGRRVDPALGYTARAFKALIREHILKN